MTPDTELLTGRPCEGVVLLTLNRPERRNALATPLLQAVAEALTAAADDDDVRAVVITGSPTVFAAGADLDELARAGADEPVQSPRFEAWRSIRAFPKPLVAAVEGWCLGAGAELMMCCDIAIAGETAKIGLPETNLGVMPGAGGTATLTRLVGRALAMRMVLTGEPIAAPQAAVAGLVSEVTPSGQALEAALSLAGRLAQRAPRALREAKASVREAAESSEHDHLLAERTRFVGLLTSDDKAEGIAAFREKRTAVWRGA